MINISRLGFLAVTISIFLLWQPVVSANENELEDGVTEAIEEETADIPNNLPKPGLTPNSPLYFLDTLAENVGLAIARSPEAKARKAFAYSEEKLAEAEEMAEEENDQAAENAALKHRDYLGKTSDNLEKAKALGKDVDALAAHVAEKTLKHQAVLSRIYDKLVAKGNENAAAAVQKAMQKSLNGHNRALQGIGNRVKKIELETKGVKVREKVQEKIRESGKSPKVKEPQRKPPAGN